MIVLFLIVCIVAGIFLAGPIAAVLVAKNRKILREMREVMDDFETIAPEYREAKKPEYRKKLAALKGKIFVHDKQSLEKARDLITIFG